MKFVNPKEIKKDELSLMKRWLQSLSEEKLIEAMAFPFERDGSGKCHEYDLLSQMVSLQPHPPTPIHPRAMGVKLASDRFANDGKNEPQRRFKTRRENPRLFQFIERQGKEYCMDDSNLASFPPEIASIVRKENKVVNSGRRRTAKERHFEVIARQFVTKWGEVLSTGPTREMKDADDRILMCVFIQSGCRLVGSAGKDERTTWCIFRNTDRSGSEENKMQVLRMLHIVSRGKAFSSPPKDIAGTYLSAWFNPTMEWFSLSAYLASRFEVALWNSFRKSMQSTIKSFVPPKTVLQETFCRLSRSDLESCVTSSLARALRRCLSETSIEGKTRDLFLFQYLSHEFGQENVERDLLSVPLVKWHSVPDHFRLIVIEYCEAFISELAGDELVKSSSLDLELGEQGARRKCNKNKSKRRKKRKKKKKKSSLGSIDEKRVESTPLESGEQVYTKPPTVSVGSNDESNEGTQKNTIVVAFDGKCLVTNHPEHLDENDEGFHTTAENSRKKSNTQVRKFILKKSKKPPLPSRIRPIAKPAEHVDVALSTHLQNQLYDNQLTMKRNNLTNAHSIWNAPSRNNHDLESFKAESSGVPSIKYQNNDLESFKAESSGVASIKYQNFSSIFTPPASNTLRKPSHPFGSGNNIGLPITTDDDFLYGMKPYEGLFSDFFNDSTGIHDANFASSTVASIASSVLDNDEGSSLEASSDERKQESLEFSPFAVKEEAAQVVDEDESDRDSIDLSPKSRTSMFPSSRAPSEVDPSLGTKTQRTDDLGENNEILAASPKATSVQLSPILLSLADLGEMRRRATFQNVGDIFKESSVPFDSQPQSLASLPVPKRSFSREDLRISCTKDDGQFHRKVPPCSSRTVDFSVLSFRNAALKNATRARSVSSHDFVEGKRFLRPQIRKAPSTKSFPSEIKTVIIDGDINFDVQSALDDHEDSSHWNVVPKIGFDENDNITTTRDGATTISSIPAPHNVDELMFLREERDSYRDMCLTMAAEISKLKNTLALERINSNYSTPQTATPFGAEHLPSFYKNRQQGSIRRFVAMSDAGFNEVPMSEDGMDAMQASVTTRRISRASNANNNRMQGNSIGKTGGSDVTSLDHDNGTYSISQNIPNYKNSGAMHQSRLSREIDYFLASVATKLQKQERRRSMATDRLTALVTTIWPRAQVLLYGSHQTDLRLPSSDLDFVIRLPNVHKKAPADAPGALEGRNAINESNQKLIARKLKSESWIEPRSIKIIERTVIPVIKVSTKDRVSRSLKLDISFDSRGHHGLESVDMIARTMEKFPMIRPVVLVLKQFLLDKGLLTAYTGGLSSHCLFLMVTRYIQEQNMTYVDVGSLLLGCLDFYGNVFDPRLFGISISNGGQYFCRPHYQRLPLQQTDFSKSLLNRRHSFQDHDNIIASSDSSRPFTFDPLFVEDPINMGNNVGRNSFRINQVQRAFSDAHRAIAASLEWDTSSGLELQPDAYPLLKSMLQDSNVSN